MNWIKFSDNNPIVASLRPPIVNLPPLEASKLTIDYIIQNYPAPYTLMASGGIDSQAMIWAWYQSKVPFSVTTIKYNDALNDHDLVQLTQFANLYNIPILKLNFDVLSFLENEYPEWAIKYNCISPMICTHMKMCSTIAGTVIFSGNALGYVYSLDYTILGLHRYAMQSGKSVVPFFFMETAELAFSFKPYLKYTEDAYFDKVNIYQAAGFPVIPQDKKMTGFEKIKDLYDELHSSKVPLLDKVQFSNKPSRRTFELLLRYPYERKLNPPTIRVVQESIK